MTHTVTDYLRPSGRKPRPYQHLKLTPAVILTGRSFPNQDPSERCGNRNEGTKIPE